MQDAQRPGRTAKPQPYKPVSPEPSCCLQDRARGAFDPWFAAESGSGRSYPGGSRGTASSSRDWPPATSANCRCRPGSKPNPQQLCADDIRAVVAAGNPPPHKRSAPDESAKRRRNNGKTCTAAEPCLQSGAIPFQSEMCRNDLETAVECYRVFANWGAFPQTPLGGRAAPRIPPAKTPATGVPSNRPARCNPSAALTVLVD